MRLYKRGRVWWCSFYGSEGRVQRSTRCHDRQAAAEVAGTLEREANVTGHLSGELEAMVALEAMMAILTVEERHRVLEWAQDRWFPRAKVIPIKRSEPPEEFITLPVRRPGPRARAPAEVLVELVKKRGSIGWKDLVDRFEYAEGTARLKLSRAVKEGVLERVGHGRYGLPGSAPDLDLVGALTSLGYKRKDSERIAALAIEELGSEATFETMIKFALKAANGKVNR